MTALLQFFKRHKGKATTGTLALLAVGYLLTRGCDIESGGFKIHVQPVNAATNNAPTNDMPALPAP